jgi:Family of unknown function (DUF5372)
VRITHAFHPLCGQEFDLIEHKSVFGESYLFFCHPSGHLRQIPAVWTDFLKTDAFVEVAAGRSTLHADFLLELAELLKQVKEGRHSIGFQGIFFANEMQLSALESEDPGAVFGLITAV